MIRILIFCPLKVEIEGDFPEAPYVIVSNHSSYLDTVFMFNVIPDYFLFLGKGDLLKWPLFKMFFKKTDIPVIKENLRKENSAYNLACRALDKGECIAIYPEGTIPLDTPKMKNFKNGAFKMAIEKQVPVVPITWQVNYKIINDLDKPFGYSLPQVVRVKIHTTIKTHGLKPTDTTALRTEIFKTIQEGL